MQNKKLILWFKEIGIKDIGKVGGKNASLGEMYQKLSKKGIIIPNGFAVTSEAYWFFLQETGLDKKIKMILKDLDTSNIKNLSVRGAKAREAILNAKFPEKLNQEIIQAYKELSKFYKKKDLDVAVRSSATAEDLPDASFAGQQESY